MSDARPNRAQAERMLRQWREAETIAQGYEAISNHSFNSKFTAEVCRREAEDLKAEILELMIGKLTK